MVNDVWVVLYHCMHKRLAAIAVSLIALVFWLPQTAQSLFADSGTDGIVEDFLVHVENNDPELAITDFDAIEERITLSDNPALEGYRFLEALVQEMNTRYNL